MYFLAKKFNENERTEARLYSNEYKAKLAQGVSCFGFGHTENRPYTLPFIQ